VYRAVRTATTIKAPIVKDLDVRNIVASVSKLWGTIPFLFSHKLMATIPKIQAIKTIPIRSINGISNTPDLFRTANPIPERNDRLTINGANFNNMDIINPPIVAKRAALDVVFFQKKPNKNMAKIPGDTNPVYSWMYWKPPFLSIPKCGAIKTAKIMDTTMVIFPILTNLLSSACLLITFLYISNVNIVATLFAFPANEATTAAVNAAKDNPFRPVGNKFNNTGYARSGFTSPPIAISCWKRPSLYST